MMKLFALLAALLIAMVIALPSSTEHKPLADTKPEAIGENAGVVCTGETFNTCKKCSAQIGCVWGWGKDILKPMSGCGGAATADVSAHGTCANKAE